MDFTTGSPTQETPGTGRSLADWSVVWRLWLCIFGSRKRGRSQNEVHRSSPIHQARCPAQELANTFEPRREETKKIGYGSKPWAQKEENRPASLISSPSTSRGRSQTSAQWLTRQARYRTTQRYRKTYYNLCTQAGKRTGRGHSSGRRAHGLIHLCIRLRR